jgi:hypothetical protein
MKEITSSWAVLQQHAVSSAAWQSGENLNVNPGNYRAGCGQEGVRRCKDLCSARAAGLLRFRGITKFNGCFGEAEENTGAASFWFTPRRGSL